ncbi:MAG: ABC transporter permease subunit [Alphaproteobacteria bacterium]|nr:ABC transporter permease subunit [Alphaproteobacteria bacterium]
MVSSPPRAKMTSSPPRPSSRSSRREAKNRSANSDPVRVTPLVAVSSLRYRDIASGSVHQGWAPDARPHTARPTPFGAGIDRYGSKAGDHVGRERRTGSHGPDARRPGRRRPAGPELGGAVAIAVSSVGFISKLIAEGIEEIDPGQVEAVRATGAGPGKVLVYGVVPQIMPTVLAVMAFRWDINIRQSSIIGLVGAGGIGIALNNAMNSFAWREVTVILLAILAIVALSEWVSTALRKRVT